MTTIPAEIIETPEPVTLDAPWFPPEMRGIWRARQLHDALSNLGWEPTRENFPNPDYPLQRSHYWVSPDGSCAIRVHGDPEAIVPPHSAACVVALIAE